jgi:RNA polymerase sigma-54 factor
MAVRQKLELRQGQSLVMTPQLQQAIKLLHMSNVELQAFVDAEIERNPLLERDETPEGGAALETAEPAPHASEEAAAGDVSEALESAGAAEDKLSSLDTDLDNVYGGEARADAAARLAPGTPDSGWSTVRLNTTSGFESEDFNLENTLSRETTLIEHVTEQMHLAIAEPSRRLIAAYLIGLLNDAGYLAGDVASVAAALGCGERAVSETLAILQGFDPPGVFARTLEECLALQLKERDRFDPAMQALVAHLDLVARHDYDALRRVCGVGMDDLKAMLAEIRRLDPKPGNAFGAVVLPPVIPDVFVRRAPDGTWLVELNSETLPRVLVNNQYYSKVAAGTSREEDKVYISECLSNATWLAKSLDQRARTILSVTREIVRQQDAFLIEGVQALRPLTLKIVAEAISMSESTVSRVTSNKYMATPRGTFELKYFFTTAIASAEGGDPHSAEAVRHRVKELIESETASSILSDDQIVDILHRAGVEIARRTVAKYRESLGIPSSVQRRRVRRAYG